jgi:exonuclease VII small subunit
MTDDTTPEPSGERAGERLDYEAAREQLLDVVRALEQGGTTLEESGSCRV